MRYWQWVLVVSIAVGACLGFGATERPGGGKATTITAEALAKEFEDNKEAATDKYRGKTIVVTGISGGNSAAISTLYLKATLTGDTVVKCFYFDTPAKEKA